MVEVDEGKGEDLIFIPNSCGFRADNVNYKRRGEKSRAYNECNATFICVKFYWANLGVHYS